MTMPRVLDKVQRSQGQPGHAWLATHPRVGWPVPPGPRAWMNQGEPWFSLVPRKRLRSADCADKTPLAQRLLAVVAAWPERAHPLPWSTLKYDETKGGYIVNLDKKMLEGAPTYDMDEDFRWTADYGRRVDKYYGAPTYW